MTLKALQRQWDAWGRKDPLWAAVTRTDKLGGGWDLGEFMRIGGDEVELMLRHLGDLGVAVDLRRALDFGCGVGRYTQALADHFEQADGVDIAPSMLDEARRLNRHGQRCQYHLNARGDLALFPGAAFTFVHSMLVLQHIPPQYAARYVGEFLRVLSPGGALVFQAPSAVPRAPGAGRLAAARPPAPLPDAAFRARIAAPLSPLSLRAGELFALAARIENVSPHPWPSSGTASGLLHVQVANRWLRADGTVHARDDGRTPLPFDLQPAQELAMTLYFVAPAAGGDYLLELDLVQEGVAWFHERGSATLRIPCTVEGGPRRGPAAAPRAPRWAGFRARHPRLHGALSRLGVVSFRRASTARWSRLREWWRRWRHPRLAMEMHALASSEVERLIEAGGGLLLETQTEHWPDGIVSARYWVVKPVSGRPGTAA